MDKTTQEAIEILNNLTEKEREFALDLLRNLAKMSKGENKEPKQ